MSRRTLEYIFVLYCSSLLFSSHLSYAGNEYLHPGEKIITVNNNVPLLMKFLKGDPRKPLILFIPGGAHLARISYGDPSSDPKDFIAYWFQKRGFPFVGISYPTDHLVSPHVCPSFTIKDWGNSAIEVARQLIRDHHLTHHIIILGWSMGGVIANSISEAATRAGLAVDFFVALDATPPIPALIPDQDKTIEKAQNGLAHRVTLRKERFLNFLHEQNRLNEHILIQDSVYTTQYLANVPVALLNTQYRYHDGTFIEDLDASIKDSGAFQYENYSLTAIVHSNFDTQHALTDKSTWSMLNAQMIYRKYFYRQKINSEQWLKVSDFLRQLPSKLTRQVHGNHFFFVGQKGAKSTVEHIIEIKREVKKINKTLEEI